MGSRIRQVDGGRWKAVPERESSVSNVKFVTSHSQPLTVLMARSIFGMLFFCVSNSTTWSQGQVSWCREQVAPVLVVPFTSLLAAFLVSDFAFILQSLGAWDIISHYLLQLKLIRMFSVQIAWGTTIKSLPKSLHCTNQNLINSTINGDHYISTPSMQLNLASY